MKYWTTESTVFALLSSLINVTIMENMDYLMKVIVFLLLCIEKMVMMSCTAIYVYLFCHWLKTD